LEFPDGRSIALSAAAYGQFLATFTPFALPLNRGIMALVIPEKRARGDRYWVARAYEAGIREAAYVGTRPDSEALRRAAVELDGRLTARVIANTVATIARYRPIGPGPVDTRDVSSVKVGQLTVEEAGESVEAVSANEPAGAEVPPWRAWHAEEKAVLEQMGQEIRAINRKLAQDISQAALGQLVDSVIDLFLAYRDTAGLSERQAKAQTIRDISRPEPA
jgi:hypothetical protein